MYLLLPVIFLCAIFILPLHIKVRLNLYLEYEDNKINFKKLKENYICLKLLGSIPVYKKYIFQTKKFKKENKKKTRIKDYLYLIKCFRINELDCLVGFNVYDYIYNSYIMTLFNMLLPGLIHIFSTNIQNVNYKTVISNDPFYLEIDSTFSVYILKLLFEYLKKKKKLYNS